MSGPVAFHAPLKPPDHPVPSGDRRMARLLVRALTLAGCEVELATRFRSYDRGGDPLRQRRLRALGQRLAARLVRRYRCRPPERRPHAWLTYHVYHKSPDWLGPAAAQALEIPYLIVEASHAEQQAEGPWACGHAGAAAAIRRADVVLAMTPVDAAGLRPLVQPPAELRRLPPFLDAAPFAAAAAARDAHRAALAARLGLDPARPWLLTVAMMREDVKVRSYEALLEALGALAGRDWQALIVGDGPARPRLERGFAALGPGRAVLAGTVEEEALPAFYAAADLFVWPALREAYGLAMLEAQAAGLPVVAGRDGGVAEVVREGATGCLVPAGDAAALAQAVARLLDHPERRCAMRARALAFVAGSRTLAQASRTLGDAIRAATRIRMLRRCQHCS